MTTAELHTDVGQKVLTAWAQSRGRVVQGSEAQQGLLTLLYKAEQLAIAKGWATPVTGSDGTSFGYFIGGAVDKAKAAAAAGDDHAIVYLAAQNAARRAQAEIVQAPAYSNALATGAELDAYDVEPTIGPVAIGIIIAVIAVAAAVAAVAWAVQTKVTVEAQTQQRTGLVAAAIDIASSSNPDVRNNPELWKLLQTLAQQEGGSGAGGFPWGTVAIVGGGLIAGKLAYDHFVK